ncbi:MAG: DUF1761 domain-containing protein [Methyloceanibacter sp.]
MSAVPINYLAVIVAAVAGFLVGWGWYTAFGKVWQDALGKRKEDCKPTPLPFIVAAVGCLLMAWMLAGLMGHLADVTLRGGVISAFFVWVGFVLTTTATNQAFRGTKHCDSHRCRPLARGTRRHGRDHWSPRSLKTEVLVAAHDCRLPRCRS